MLSHLRLELANNSQKFISKFHMDFSLHGLGQPRGPGGPRGVIGHNLFGTFPLGPPIKTTDGLD